MTRSRTAAAGLALIACLVAGCEKNLPVEANDRDVVLRAGDLIPYGYGLKKTEPYETFTKTRYFDGSRELTYEYQPPELRGVGALYINITVSVEKTNADAWGTQHALEVGLAVGFKANDLEKREIKDFYKYGDSSAFYILEKDGKPIGNLFSVRDGNRALVLVIAGMYFDDAGTWKELIEEKLHRFSKYAPT